MADASEDLDFDRPTAEDLVADAEDRLIAAVSRGLEQTPIYFRLQLAKHLVFDNGGNDGAVGRNPALVGAVSIIDTILAILREHPEAANLERLNGIYRPPLLTLKPDTA